jgi:hypothetical protein
MLTLTFKIEKVLNLTPNKIYQGIIIYFYTMLTLII